MHTKIDLRVQNLLPYIVSQDEQAIFRKSTQLLRNPPNGFLMECQKINPQDTNGNIKMLTLQRCHSLMLRPTGPKIHSQSSCMWWH